MNVAQLGRLIQSITPDFVRFGNQCANSEIDEIDGTSLENLAEDLERIAREIRLNFSQVA